MVAYLRMIIILTPQNVHIICPQKHDLPTLAWACFYLLFDDRAFGPSNDAYPKIESYMGKLPLSRTYNCIDCNWPLPESNQICDSNGGDKDSGTGRDSPKLNSNCILIKCPKLSLVTQIEFNEFEQLYIWHNL